MKFLKQCYCFTHLSYLVEPKTYHQALSLSPTYRLLRNYVCIVQYTKHLHGLFIHQAREGGAELGQLQAGHVFV